MDRNNDVENVTVSKKDEPKSQLPTVLMSHSKEIVSAVVVGVLITIFSSAILDYFSSDVEPDENIAYLQSFSQVEGFQPSQRDYFIRASLANVVANITPVKMQIIMYFQMMGEFPTKKSDIDIASFDLEEHDHIISSYMTDNGGIGVDLSKEFGNDKYLTLQPSASKNGAFIKWNCITNIDEKYLGIPKNRMCEYQKSL